jgi:hypothetical protein
LVVGRYAVQPLVSAGQAVGVPPSPELPPLPPLLLEPLLLPLLDPLLLPVGPWVPLLDPLPPLDPLLLAVPVLQLEELTVTLDAALKFVLSVE